MKLKNSVILIIGFIWIISAIGNVSASNNTTNSTNCTNSTGLADSDWPSFQNDANKTGQSNYTGPQTNTTKWTYDNITVYGSAVIGKNGTLYIAGGDGILYAFSSAGKLLWTYTTRSKIYGSPTLGNDGTIYISNWMNSTTYAISSKGTLIWKCNTGGYNFGSSPVIGSDGTVYIATTDETNGTLYAIDKTGTILWPYTTGIIRGTSPVIGSDGTIYMADYNGVLYAINKDGSLKWFTTLRYKVNNTNYYVNIFFNSMSIGPDGTIYVACHNGRYISTSKNEIRSNIGVLYALTDTGTNCVIKWFHDFGEVIYGVPAIDDQGNIYLLSATKLNALNSNGNVIWSIPTEGVSEDWLTSPVIGKDGSIYFGSSNNFYAVNSTNGSLKWKYATGDVVGSPAIAADGTLYIGALNGTFYAFNDKAADFKNESVKGTELTVKFTGTSTDIPVSWKWDFGDGTTSSLKNPSHTYSKAGNYNVTLTVTLLDGSFITRTKKLTIIKQDITAPTVKNNVKGGKYNDTQYINLTATDNDKNTVIYYTLDGTDPLTSSTRTLYTNSIEINDSTTLKYDAVDSTGNWSPVYTNKYTILDVIYIGDASGYDSKTINKDIQAILDGAESGSKVVFKGKSYENLQLTINKKLEIISNVGTKITTNIIGLAVFLINGTKASGTKISGFKIVTITGSGIIVSNTSNVNISKVNVSSSNGTAIKVTGSKNTTIENSTLQDSSIGVYIYNSSKTLLKQNTITDNQKKGVMIDNSTNTTVTNSTITGNGDNSSTVVDDGGIYVLNSDQVKITNNVINSNFMGISTSSVSNLTIASNVINYNFVDGIYLTDFAKEIVIKTNVIQKNANGIGVDYSDGENVSISGNNIAYSVSRGNEIKIPSAYGMFTAGDGVAFGINYITAKSESIQYNAIYNNDYRDVDGHDELNHAEGELLVGVNIYTNSVVDVDHKFCCKINSQAARLVIERTGDGTYKTYFVDPNTNEIIGNIPGLEFVFDANGKSYVKTTDSGEATITLSASELLNEISSTFSNNHDSTSTISQITGENDYDHWEGLTDYTGDGSDNGNNGDDGGSGDGSNNGDGSGNGDGSSSESGSGSSSSNGESTGSLAVGAAAASASSAEGSSSGSSGQTDSKTVQELILNDKSSIWGIITVIILIIIVIGAYYRKDILTMINKSKK